MIAEDFCAYHILSLLLNLVLQKAISCCAHVFQRALMQERTVPAINEGEKGAKNLLELARALVV